LPLQDSVPIFEGIRTLDGGKLQIGIKSVEAGNNIGIVYSNFVAVEGHEAGCVVRL
jgi:hypothetical protein